MLYPFSWYTFLGCSTLPYDSILYHMCEQIQSKMNKIVYKTNTLESNIKV